MTNQRRAGAEGRADPEAAIDGEIGPAAPPRRDQLVDGGIDRRIFAADAEAGGEAKERKGGEVPRRRGRDGSDGIDRDGDEKQFLASQAIGQMAEAERADDRAGKIDAGREADLGIADTDRLVAGDRARERADQRHFEAVEHPGDAERDHDSASGNRSTAGGRGAPGYRSRTIPPASQRAHPLRHCYQ